MHLTQVKDKNHSDLLSIVVNASDLNFFEEIYMDDINSLDLETIKLKLSDKKEGVVWSVQKCNQTEVEYKRFLALKRAFKNKYIVPHTAISKFWHQHFLDTEKYTADCEKIFGYFLQDYPFFGMDSKEDTQDLSDAFEETKLLYKRHFGDDYFDYAKRC